MNQNSPEQVPFELLHLELVSQVIHADHEEEQTTVTKTGGPEASPTPGSSSSRRSTRSTQAEVVDLVVDERLLGSHRHSGRVVEVFSQPGNINISGNW